MRNAEIVIVSGSYGAGHDAAAEALAEQLNDAGHVVRRLDVADALRWRGGAFLRWLYFTQLRFAPASWGATLRFLERHDWAFRAVRRSLGLLGRPLVREVADAGLVISTHPFASQILGEARTRGAAGLRVVTYLTDASVHRLWVHPGVDLHLGIHEVSARQCRERGGETCIVRPLVLSTAEAVAPGWLPPWPSGRPAALIVGGSAGVGDLYASALDVLATGLMAPVVACGTNTSLRERLQLVPGVVALDWRGDMPALVSAADCVLQNAGGMTSLEALTAGTPTFTYRPLPGHGTTNADALDLAGLIPWIRQASQLEEALTRVLTSPGRFGLPTTAPQVVDVLARHLLLPVQPLQLAA